MLNPLQDAQFNDFFQLLQASFPKDEYRPYQDQKALLKKPGYQVYIHEREEELAGCFACWQTADFVFLEHFAVKPKFRNGGLGSNLLQAFQDQLDRPVIIETELPETDLAKRRMVFYERNGFARTDWSYLQPPLAEGLNPVPLCLMSSPRPLSEEDYQAFKAWVFEEVYT